MTLAVVGDELGPIENYALREADPGLPGEGEVRVTVQAAGVSFADWLNATGQYQVRRPTPFTPGSEFAGRVESIGSGVEGLAVGDRVSGTTHGGAFAQAIVMPAAALRPVPARFDYAEAATFMASAATAWHALVDRARLAAGETLLVLGAGGAVGYAAVQIGKHLGARVIASASSEDKRSLAIAGGADAEIDGHAEDWRERVSAANDGRPIDVVFDPVGGAATERAFRCLAWNGRHLVVGFPAGIAQLPTNLPLLKGASLVGVNIGGLAKHDPALGLANAEKLAALAKRGLFRPHVAHRFPLEDFAEAMRLVASGKPAGRVVLTLG